MEILAQGPKIYEDDAQRRAYSILPAPKLKGCHTPGDQLPPGTEFVDLRNSCELCFTREGQNGLIETKLSGPRSARSDEYPSRTDCCYPRNFSPARCVASLGWRWSGIGPGYGSYPGIGPSEGGLGTPQGHFRGFEHRRC